MTPAEEAEHQAMLDVFARVQAGDRVEVVHQVKVGFRSWETTTPGVVVEARRRRLGLHYRRNFDDKAFCDLLVLRRDDGELTTVTLDEYSRLRILSSNTASVALGK